jgi:hypothetical protein
MFLQPVLQTRKRYRKIEYGVAHLINILRSLSVLETSEVSFSFGKHILWR